MVSPASTWTSHELRVSPFAVFDGVAAHERVTGASFTLDAREQRVLATIAAGTATDDDRAILDTLRVRRLVLDRAAFDEIGARTLGSLDLEVAGACNAECTFCPREPLRAGRGVGIMRPEMFAAVLDRLGPYLGFVGFAGIGEPTLNKHLPAFLRALSDRRIRTMLVTNGSLLTDELIGALLDAGVGTVQVSFNGLDRASYEDHMVGLDFVQTRTRVERLVELARGRIPVMISAVETERNGAQLAGFAEYWAARGVRAHVVPCHSRGGTIIPLGKRPSEPPSIAPRCGLFAARAFVSWDGRVLACCHDIDGKSELGRIPDDDAATLIARKLDVMRGDRWFAMCGGCDEPARLEPLTFPAQPRSPATLR